MDFVYKGKHYRLPDGTSNEDALAKIQAFEASASQPEASAASAPTPGSAPPTHTMPDGSTMPGATHEAAVAAEAPAPPDIRPGFNRAIKGFADYTIPSASTLSTLFKRAAEPPVRFSVKDGKVDMELAGGPAFWRDATVGQIESTKEAARTATERGASGDRAGAAAAAAGAVPIVGPMVRDLAETGLSGDYASLGGKLAGIALPFGVSKARVAAPLESAATRIETRGLGPFSSARASVIRAVDPAAKYTPEFLDNARQISRDIGVMHSREGMLDRLAGSGALSREAQKAAKVAGHPADSLLGQSERNLRIVKSGVSDIPITPEQMEAAALRVEQLPPASATIPRPVAVPPRWTPRRSLPSAPRPRRSAT